MTASILSHASFTAWPTQPRVLLAFFVLALGLVGQASVVADWLATSSTAALAEADPGGGPASPFLPFGIAPALLALHGR